MGDIANCTSEDDTHSLIYTRTPDEIFLMATRFYIQKVLTPIVVVIGIIGNLVTIIVLSQRRMKSSTNTYLTALAISDSLYLICAFLLSLLHHSWINDVKYRLYWKLLPFVFWYIDASSGTSIWLTVSFALERYIAVCHPLRGRVLCTESRARKVIFGVVVFNVLTTLSTSFEWSVCLNSKNKPMLIETELSNNVVYKAIYYWFTAFVFVYIPLVSLCVLNYLLVVAVHNSQRQRSGLTQVKHGGISNRERQENKITMALVAIVLLLIVCQIPTTILLILSVFYKPKSPSKDYNYHRAFSNICNFLMCVNAATNFLLYCAMSDKYRRTLVITLVPCVAKHHRTLTASSMASYRSSRCSVRYPRRTASCAIPPNSNSLRPPSVQY